MPASNLDLIIREFLRRYQREYDFYLEISRRVASICDTELKSNGVRARVTNRAKNPERLWQKVYTRSKKYDYQSVEDIYKNIVDLAGVRIELYFPSNDVEVDKIIRNLFHLTEDPKIFPKKREDNGIYTMQFSGYKATHYRVQMLDSSMTGMDRRYLDAMIEIQVASVLMHAWSEVEHDLAYKPLMGNVSEEEYAILDEINGLVMAGEIALTRLQKAIERRTRSNPFSNHYELASYLYDKTQSKVAEWRDQVMGRVDLLFKLIKHAELNLPERIDDYLNRLYEITEKRPLAEQMIDLILLARPELNDYFLDISHASESEDLKERDPNMSFLRYWVAYVSFLREITPILAPQIQRVVFPNSNILNHIGIFSEEEIITLELVRNFRNYYVHNIHAIDDMTVSNQTNILKNILQPLLNNDNQQVGLAMERAFQFAGIKQ